VTPIGQQNPPGPLKLLGLRKKQAKIPIFDFAKKDRFFRRTFCNVPKFTPRVAAVARG
jgi:hypothetical protein